MRYFVVVCEDVNIVIIIEFFENFWRADSFRGFCGFGRFVVVLAEI